MQNKIKNKPKPKKKKIIDAKSCTKTIKRQKYAIRKCQVFQEGAIIKAKIMKEVYKRLNIKRLTAASALVAITTFTCVHAALNAAPSEEQVFMDRCRQLNGLAIQDPEGKTMDKKMICLRKEAVLGWLARK